MRHGACLLVCLLLGLNSARADDPKPVAGDAKLKRLNPEGTVLIDVPGKRLLLKTKVVLREGALELLCCLKQTKEHESILAFDGKAQAVHAGLLALKAKAGTPAKLGEDFKPATGQPLAMSLIWTDEEGVTHSVPARSWVRQLTRRWFVQKMDSLPEGLTLPDKSDLRYDRKHKELAFYGPMSDEKKAEFLALSKDKAFRSAIESFHQQGQNQEMQAEWVFVGSGFYKNTKGEESYAAEGGDLISVSNFPEATIDVSIRSSNEDASLLFEAWTERIPAKDTDVTLEIVPVFEKATGDRR